MSYNTLTKAANHDPGLSDFFFCELSAFLVLQDADPGTQTISATHTFTSPEGFKKAFIIPEKHTGKASTVGSLGSQTLKNEFEIFIPGIDDATLVFVKNAINDTFITIHTDADCDNPQKYQLGNACKPERMTSDMSIGTFEPTGEKGFMMKVTWAGIPYIYAGAITMKT